MPANPNHTAKARTQAARVPTADEIEAARDAKASGTDKAPAAVASKSSAGTGQLSRREREALQAQQAKERYQKLHAEGKTDEARADMARLRLVREERDRAAATKKAELEEREAQDRSKREQLERMERQQVLAEQKKALKGKKK